MLILEPMESLSACFAVGVIESVDDTAAVDGSRGMVESKSATLAESETPVSISAEWLPQDDIASVKTTTLTPITRFEKMYVENNCESDKSTASTSGIMLKKVAIKKLPLLTQKPFLKHETD